MEKITISELEAIMRDFNRRFPEKQDSCHLEGVIVFKPENWETEYSEKSRSYEVANCNRAFQDGKISNALVGNCLDGTDQGVRLDWYKWKVDYCYMK